MIFGDILIDESATCHVASGNAYAFTHPSCPTTRKPRTRLASTVRRAPDAMTGGADLDVLGVHPDDEETRVLIGDTWVLT